MEPMRPPSRNQLKDWQVKISVQKSGLKKPGFLKNWELYPESSLIVYKYLGIYNENLAHSFFDGNVLLGSLGIIGQISEQNCLITELDVVKLFWVSNDISAVGYTISQIF